MFQVNCIRIEYKNSKEHSNYGRKIKIKISISQARSLNWCTLDYKNCQSDWYFGISVSVEVFKQEAKFGIIV